MANPVIVITDDIDVFATRAEAERYIEPFLLRTPGFAAFDHTGRRLKPSTQRRGLAEVVTLTDDPDAAPDEVAVRQALKRFLRQSAGMREPELESLSLDRLFSRAMEFKTK
jgi:hypothetical protein